MTDQVSFPKRVLTRIARQPWLRRIVLPVMSRVNPGNIEVKHHWTGEKVYLNSFRHKGYWFYGRAREGAEMVAMQKLVRSSDTVFDIGAHIGYTALFLAALARAGHIHCFEPGSNNLPYLRRNVSGKPNVTIVESALADYCGTATMSLEEITGQNNSLDQSMNALMRNTAPSAFVAPRIHQELVAVTTVDRYCSDSGADPQFIKIDVEGYELEVLKGAPQTLASTRPIMMVEVSQNHAAVMGLIRAAGYLLYDSSLLPLQGVPQGTQDVFCLHADAHLWAISQLATQDGSSN